MTDQRLETEIREVFDAQHEPSPDLENRIIAGLPWNAAQPAKRAASVSRMPRLAGAFAAAIAGVLIAVLLAPSILSRLQWMFPGAFGDQPPAYSVAAVSGQSVFVVQRKAENVLLQSTDDGQSWVDRLHFPGVYGGMEVVGDAAFIWSLDMQFHSCTAQPCEGMTQALTLYRSMDAGIDWTALPQTDFPVEDVYFLDANLGWADSDSPATGLNAEVLYQTADGGITWSRVGPLPAASPMGYVFGVGNHRVTFSWNADGTLRGWYAGATQLFTTSDRGHSWRPVGFAVPAAVAGFTAAPQQPEFDASSGVVAIAYRNPSGADNATPNAIYLYMSSDGGATWGDPRPGPSGFAPVGDDLSVAILDHSTIWLTSQSLSGGDNVQAGPEIARTTDGGANWQVVRHTPRILQIMPVDPLHAYALVVDGPYNVNEIFRTEDGGKTWRQLSMPVFPPKNA